jgi:hypothetical protein
MQARLTPRGAEVANFSPATTRRVNGPPVEGGLWRLAISFEWLVSGLRIPRLGKGGPNIVQET